MEETVDLGDIQIQITFKKIKNVHLSVYPPEGRVHMAVPENTRVEAARAYGISKLSWIRKQRELLLAQEREPERQFVERESHVLWGRRYLLSVIESDGKPFVKIDHRRIFLHIRPGTSQLKKEEIIHEWHLSLLHKIVPNLIRIWEQKLSVKATGYNLQRMKTKWGSCNTKSENIRLNTELVKKPKDLLEYVIVHELIHLLEPTHSDRFISILNKNYPKWNEARMELNDLPLSAEKWKE